MIEDVSWPGRDTGERLSRAFQAGLNSQDDPLLECLCRREQGNE